MLCIGFDEIAARVAKDGHRDVGERSRRGQNADQEREACPADRIPGRPLSCQHPLCAECGEHSAGEGGDIKHRARRPEELRTRHHRVDQLVERGVAAPRPKQRDYQGAEPEPGVRAIPVYEPAAKREEREYQDGGTDILAVKMDAITAPVPLEDPRELREIHVDRFLERKRKTGGVVVSLAAGTWRPRYVLLHGEILNCPHDRPEHDRTEGQHQTRERSAERGVSSQRR